jgi:hypothetical protein
MSGVISSGNAIVDAMGRIDIVGDLLPLSWLKEITYENGRPDYIGAVILADLVYWYRHSIISDEEGGSVRWKKKFNSDLVQMGYRQIQRRFNLSRDQAKNAIRRLEERGLIKRHFRNVEERGRLCNNVMYIEINPSNIQISFHRQDLEICVSFFQSSRHLLLQFSSCLTSFSSRVHSPHDN